MKKALVLITFLLLLPILVQAQKVGLVLSGGGAKGLTHIGIIRALEENNIPIDYITGTSMGTIFSWELTNHLLSLKRWNHGLESPLDSKEIKSISPKGN